MFKYFGIYIQEHRDRARAWWSLSKGHADRQAAESLFILNRLAKGRGVPADIVYQLKNQAVRLFYQKGYCTRVTKSVQEMECWHTQRYLDGETDYCPKCDNTGVYRRYALYSFVFYIDGKRFNWHQPEGMVTWPVMLNEGIEIYSGERSNAVGAKQDVNRAVWVVYQWLRQNEVAGEDLPRQRNLLQALQIDLIVIREGWIYQIHQWAEYRNGPVARRIREWERERIPF
jgi:hypothetical protein